MGPDHFRQLNVKRRVIMSDINGFQIAGSLKRHHRFLKMCLLILCVATLALFTRRDAQGVSIEHQPMEAAATSAAPNIMFLLDDSGSMDWEFMTQDADGKFYANGNSKEYVFDDPASDNTYTDSNGDILSGSDREYYKSQCAGYNKVYYNPKSEYRPWPSTLNYTFIDADLNNPKCNPINAAKTFDLSNEYRSFSSCTHEVDNEDGVPAFTTTGPWTDNGSYLWTASDAAYTAVWQQVIPTAGQYEVFARWTANTSRCETVVYSVTDINGTTATPPVNQRNNNLVFMSLGTFDYTAGFMAQVSLDFTRVGDTDRRSADAVRFVRTPCPAVSISNAHYYTWEDTNDDGKMDAGETVYLVNFTTVAGDFSDVARAYYGVTYDGSGKVTDLASIAALPDNVKSVVYDEEDKTKVDHYRTDEEDLQNFANWYSYYRRRELATKAAVANTINEMEAVKVGLYTINSSIAPLEVQPVELNCALVGADDPIIVDNNDSTFSRSSTGWSTSTSSSDYGDNYLYANNINIGNWAKWKPDIPSDGDYEVFVRWVQSSSRQTEVEYVVHDSTGDHSVGGSGTGKFNQTTDGGQWHTLGTFKFLADDSGYVKLTAQVTGTSRYCADAVMFVPMSAGPVGTVFQDKTNDLLDQVYKIHSSGGTPLRIGLNNVGHYFDADDSGDNGGVGSAPWAACADGGACQKSFAILMTDGYWNGGSPGVGHQDSGQGIPYQDSHSDTLADVAMKYYKKDLAPALEDSVAPSGCDKAIHQHMTTYSVSFGVVGTLDPNAYAYYGDNPPLSYNPCLEGVIPGGAGGWPDPESGSIQRKIDDLWHAAVNGRGQFFSASNPEELVASLQTIVESVEKSVSSGASVSVNGEELSEETVLYQARFKSDGWVGEVIAKEINPKTRVISPDELWNASDQLQLIANPSTTRKIVTFNTSSDSVIKFQASEFQSHQKLALDPGNNATLITNLVNFLRGDPVTGMRLRTKILGDIVHSAPVFVSSFVPANNDGIDNDNDNEIDEEPDGKDNDLDGETDEQDEWEWKKQATLYCGGNDGMVHAFDAEDGTERFAYIPNLLFDETENDPSLGVVSKLRFLASTDYQHRFFVDNTASFKEISRDADLDKVDNDGDGWDNEGDGLDNDDDGITDEKIDGKDSDGDGCIDELGNCYLDKSADGIDNDSDGRTDETDEKFLLVDSKGELEIGEIRTLLVGGLGYGGKGYYGLTVRRAVQTGGVWTEIFNADRWDFLDPLITESTIAANLLAWEYPDLETLNSDGVDNDNDGLIDEGTDGITNDIDGDIDERDEYETDPDMGYSYSSAYIVKSFSIEHPWVVIFGNGYNSDNGEAVLYVLDAFDGALVKKIHTECGPDNGLSTPALVALTTKESLIKWNTEGADGRDNDGDGSIDEADEINNDGDNYVDEGTDNKDNNGDGIKDDGPFDNLDNDNDGFVDEVDSNTAELGEWEMSSMALDDTVAFAYAGDLKGNLWKFDLTSPDPADWDVSYKCRNGQDCNADNIIDASDFAIVGNPQPLFQAVGQSITTKPDVMRPCKAGLNGHMVIFGTGKYLDMSDRSGPFSTQTLYGIWDYGDSYDPNKSDATNYYDDGEYLGSLDRATGRLSNFDPADNVKLLKQEELAPPHGWIDYTDMHGNTIHLRLTSDYDASYVGVPDKNSSIQSRDPDGHDWGSDGIDNDGDGDTNEDLCGDGIDNDMDGTTDEADECDCVAGLNIPWTIGEKCGTWAADGLDNDNDGTTDEADEEVSHVGWYFDLPGFGDKAAAGVRYGERVIEDLIIRGGVIIAITSVVSETPCSGGGESLVMELDACTGARMSSAQFDINGDGKVDADDMINIGTVADPIWVAPSARMFQGLLQPPVILKKPGGGDLKVLSDSAGGTQTIDEKGAGENFQYWQELSVLP